MEQLILIVDARTGDVLRVLGASRPIEATGPLSTWLQHEGWSIVSLAGLGDELAVAVTRERRAPRLR